MGRIKYDIKYIAFIDILGFRNKVNESINDMKVYANIQKALKVLLKEKQNKIKIKGEQITTFSDSIVISYPANDSDNILLLGKIITFLQMELFKYDMLIRGGITKGEIHHTKEVVFGPGFNDAYELESKYAIFPRVIMYKELYDSKIKELGNYQGYESDIQIFKNTFAVDSLTNMVYVDVLNCLSELDYLEDYENYLILARNLILNSLKKEKSKEVKSKYIWLANYYNKNLNKYKKLINKDEFRIPGKYIKH